MVNIRVDHHRNQFYWLSLVIYCYLWQHFTVLLKSHVRVQWCPSPVKPSLHLHVTLSWWGCGMQMAFSLHPPLLCVQSPGVAGPTRTNVTMPVYDCAVKAAFHYSSRLQTWLQTWFSTRFTATFSTSSCEFATRFRPAFDCFFCRKPGREQQRVRQMECKKTRLKLSTCFRPACDQVFDQVCSWLE